MNENNLAVLILAAGKGKRMNNPNLPKVLTLLNEKPLLGYVLELSEKLNPKIIISIVGHFKELVINYIDSFSNPKFNYAVQEEQLGTGHAVRQAENLLANFQGNVLILSGDVPLLKQSTLEKFIQLHLENHSDLSVLSSRTSEPKGYGRIVRDIHNSFIKITEEKDADDSVRLINEINSGIYLVEKNLLFESLKSVSNKNAQAEYYLTDIIEIIKNQNKNVFAFDLASFEETQGINSQEDLENVKKLLLT